MSARRALVIAGTLAAFFVWWGLRVPRHQLAEAGPVVLVRAAGPDRAVSQVFLPGLSSLSTIVVTTHAEGASHLRWTLDLAASADVFRRTRRVASGTESVEPGRHALALPLERPLLANGSEATLTMWFEGQGADGASLEASGLDAYPGRLVEANASRFGDLRLAVSGPNLYSDLRLRLGDAPPWLRLPIVHAAVVGIFLAALTGFMADVTTARGEQG